MIKIIESIHKDFGDFRIELPLPEDKQERLIVQKALLKGKLFKITSRTPTTTEEIR